jgi:hypothetical protein
MLDETVSVIVAAVDCPSAITAPCRFQVTVNGPLALVRLKLLMLKLSVMAATPRSST